jgi:small subunit ribosomal protein S1
VPEGGAVTVGERRERPPRGSGPQKKKQPIVVAEQRLPPAVPKPSRRDALSADLEAEMAAALGGQSLDDLLTTGGAMGGATRDLMELDSRRSATIVRVHGDNVFFSLDGRHEGVASTRQFRDPPEPGQQYDVVIKSFNAEDGFYEVVIPGASVEVADWSDIREGSVVEAKVTGANTGGLECEVNRLRGFIPISQIAIYRVEDTAEFVGQKMLCVITEANPQRRNLVLSRRAMLEREKEDAKRAFYQDLQVGQIREGVVRKIEDFGAFVDLGGADGLIHLSQLSWERVKHPSDVLKEGQKVQVRVERFDPQTNKIGLSLRSLQEHPWANINSRFPVGATVRGPVTRLAKFGAFVKLAPGVEGLIHISELAHQRVNQVGNVVQEGQEVEVKILTIDEENQRIGLSLKALMNAPQAAKAAVEEGEEAPREPVIKKRPGPLKGGFDRPTGGEGLGLKW